MTISSAVPGLETALSTALRGARAAGERFARAATNIAGVGTGTPRATDPVADAAAFPSFLAAQEAPDLATEMVRVQLAQRAYAANLATLRSADRMAAEALRLLR